MLVKVLASLRCFQLLNWCFPNESTFDVLQEISSRAFNTNVRYMIDEKLNLFYLKRKHRLLRINRTTKIFSLFSFFFFFLSIESEKTYVRNKVNNKFDKVRLEKIVEPELA